MYLNHARGSSEVEELCARDEIRLPFPDCEVYVPNQAVTTQLATWSTAVCVVSHLWRSTSAFMISLESVSCRTCGIDTWLCTVLTCTEIAHHATMNLYGVTLFFKAHILLIVNSETNISSSFHQYSGPQHMHNRKAAQKVQGHSCRVVLPA